jgi:hypothetical protein
MLVSVSFGVIGSIAKYFARGFFWAFRAFNFINGGLFGGTLATSMTYASDVSKARAESDSVIGSLVGIYMIGSIAMESMGLFCSTARRSYLESGCNYLFLPFLDRTE